MALGFRPLVDGGILSPDRLSPFCPKLTFIPEHLLVLFFWMGTTALVMMFVRDLLLWRHVHFLFISTVVIPALSCYLLYLIYGISIIGNIYWETTPGVNQIIHFIPSLLGLMRNFQIPPALLFSVLVIPFAALVLIFQGRSRDFIIWYWALKETLHLLSPRARKMVFLFGFLVWSSLAVFFGTADPSIEVFQISTTIQSSVFLN